MSELQSPVAQAAGLSQWQRIANAFSAPSRTFEDIRRGNRSWWLPFIVLACAGYLFFAVVNQKVGIEQTAENQIRLSSRSQDRMAEMTPEQQQRAVNISVEITKYVFIATPAIGLGIALAMAAIFMGTINFGFGGRTKFAEVFAVFYYAWLPSIVKVLLGIAVLLAGAAPESFNVKNFAPTNVGAFLDPESTNHALYALASAVDAITIWSLVLMGIGIATVAGVKRKAGYITAFGWWGLWVLLSVGLAAAFS